MREKQTMIRPWMIGLLAIIAIPSIGWAIAASIRADGGLRFKANASAGTSGTAANPVIWSDATTLPNLRFSDGTADRYVQACSPTTNGDYCSWNGTNWVRAAAPAGGGGSTSHLIGSTGTPTFSAGAQCPSCTASITGTDLAGKIAITTAGTPSAGAYAVVNFNTAYGAAPYVVLGNCDLNAGALTAPQAYVSSRGTTSFTISENAALTAGFTWTLCYIVAQ